MKMWIDVEINLLPHGRGPGGCSNSKLALGSYVVQLDFIGPRHGITCQDGLCLIARDIAEQAGGLMSF